MVSVSGKMSSTQEIKICAPQGWRLSPLLCICLMADLDQCVQKSFLSNFADDTQSIIISDDKDETLEIIRKGANSVIGFFSKNNLVNNADKAAVLYNSRGRWKTITVENIGSHNSNPLTQKSFLGCILILISLGIPMLKCQYWAHKKNRSLEHSCPEGLLG